MPEEPSHNPAAVRTQARPTARGAALRVLHAAQDFARGVVSLVHPDRITLAHGWEHGAQCIAGKIVLITGSTRGIGRAAAQLFAAHGACIAVHGRDAGKAAEIAVEVREAGGHARGYGADLSVPGEATRLVHAVIDDFGALDVLINNGAVLPQHKEPPWKGGSAEFAKVMATNVIAPFEASMAAVSWMEAQGRTGRIVNISSSVADASNPKLGLAAYAISKIALEGFSRYLARESQDLGVVVTTLRAPTADTDMIRTHVEAELRPQLPRAEEAARLYLWMATAPASQVNGRVRMP
jgi:3-oxoacyl-[acyl-carrier protein] reductase